MELIGIREAGRRLGVSDTAIHKAIKSGRIDAPRDDDRDPANGRPRLRWPLVRDQYIANSDVSKRSHVGSRGSPVRAKDAPRVRLPTSDRMDETPSVGDQPVGDGPKSGRGPGYAQARALREAYMARLAKLEFEERSGKLVDVDTLRVEAFKVHRRIRDAILNIPDRCAPKLAAMSDPADVHAVLLEEITQALRGLAADVYAPYGQQPTN